MAHDPEGMRGLWDRLKVVMAPGAIDPLVKEMISVGLSTANGCGCCFHSHTAAETVKGVTRSPHSELMAVIGMPMQTNGLVQGPGGEVDAAFKA